MPKVWTGGFPDNLRPRPGYVPRFHFSLRGPSGGPASNAPGGGRPSLALLVPSRALTCYFTGREASGPQTSSCLLWRLARRECRLKQRMAHWIVDAITLALSGTGCALPVQVESSLYKKCGILLGAGLMAPH